MTEHHQSDTAPQSPPAAPQPVAADQPTERIATAVRADETAAFARPHQPTHVLPEATRPPLWNSAHSDQPAAAPSLGPLAGWENASGQVRALAGPVITHEDARHVIGLQARVDGATRSFAGLAVAASMRGVLFPDYRGDALAPLSFGVGIRIR